MERAAQGGPRIRSQGSQSSQVSQESLHHMRYSSSKGTSEGGPRSVFSKPPPLLPCPRYLLHAQEIKLILHLQMSQEEYRNSADGLPLLRFHDSMVR